MRIPSVRTALLVGLALATPLGALASDHNEPSPDPVWPAESALHKEWDLSDLFAWQDIEGDRMNVIIAWHPQQLPLDPGQRASYSDRVLFKLNIRYDREGANLPGSGTFDREITFRYGRNAAGAWGMLAAGLPGTPPVVLDCDSELGWAGHAVEIGSGKTTGDPEGAIWIATGIWDDPFVFDIDGFNASLTRALAGEEGLQFDPKRDTFEGLNASGIVLSIPMSAFEDHWEDFDRGGLFGTEKVHVWATTHITAAEAAREGN